MFRFFIKYIFWRFIFFRILRKQNLKQYLIFLTFWNKYEKKWIWTLQLGWKNWYLIFSIWKKNWIFIFDLWKKID